MDVMLAQPYICKKITFQFSQFFFIKFQHAIGIILFISVISNCIINNSHFLPEDGLDITESSKVPKVLSETVTGI